MRVAGSLAAAVTGAGVCAVSLGEGSTATFGEMLGVAGATAGAVCGAAATGTAGAAEAGAAVLAAGAGADVVLSSVSLNLSVMVGAEIEMHDSEVQLRGMFTRTLCPSTLKEKELPACADALAISIAAIRTSFRMGASRTGVGCWKDPMQMAGRPM